MKKSRIIPFIFTICLVTVIFSNCEMDALGNRRLALFSNNELFQIARAQYDEEIENYRKDGKLIEPDKNGNFKTEIHRQQYKLYQDVGADIKKAAEDWVKKEGNSSKLNKFYWEFALVDDPTVNAWAMPGALIVFYTGILDVCKDDAGIAFVMGHEIAHALLNHTQQRISQAQVIQLTAAIVGGILNSDLAALAVNLGLNLTVAPQNSQKNETEADKVGQELMAIARYDPAQAPIMWKRMEDRSGGGSNALAFLSTHPTHASRIKELTDGAPKAASFARNNFSVTSFKNVTPIPGIR